jgi:L-methionine (R)-S-oxide reductase
VAESITITGTGKQEKYASLLPQLKSLAEETDEYAALGNIISALKYGMGFFWAGIYIVKESEKEKEKLNSKFKIQNLELVLGPFQGTIACTRISFGKGVCGHAWQHKKTVIVDDVNTFKGHIACSSESKSEIVLPVFAKNGEVIMILDIDSDKHADFDSIDEKALTQVVHIIESIVNTEH